MRLTPVDCGVQSVGDGTEYSAKAASNIRQYRARPYGHKTNQ